MAIHGSTRKKMLHCVATSHQKRLPNLKMTGIWKIVMSTIIIPGIIVTVIVIVIAIAITIADTIAIAIAIAIAMAIVIAIAITIAIAIAILPIGAYSIFC